MSRRFAVLAAVAAVCIAVAFVAVLRALDDGRLAARPTAPPLPPLALAEWDPESLPEPTDPAAAVDAILDVRARFGSVLTNSELAVPEPAAPTALDGSAPSFDAILRARAGLPEPLTAEDAEPIENGPATADGDLEQSLRGAASLLLRRAEEARARGDLARHQRLTGLAMLLNSEADAPDGTAPRKP